MGEAQDNKDVEKRVIKGEYQLVFITPESIMENTKFRRMLHSDEYRKELVAVVVDEAHCIKTWGDKFRTSFSKIGELRSLIPTIVNILALIATATLETYHIICEILSMSDPCLIALPPSRDNIRYQVKSKIRLEDLVSLLSHSLLERRVNCPKTVVFVRQYSDCSNLYLMIQSIVRWDQILQNHQVTQIMLSLDLLKCTVV